jgi:crotonobetainyl-CoA:carnitine CoA-transferase CaiB-like acyl-CoA transferase
MVLAVGNDRQFAALCKALDIPADPRFGTNADRVAHVDELADLIGERLAAAPARHWFDLLTPLGVPCGPVNDIAAAFALADELGMGARVSVGEPGEAVDLVANPIGLSATPPTYRRRPPRLGEHTDELLQWLENN